MKDSNTYVNRELGFSIEKPEEWIFLPGQWALNLLINRPDPSGEVNDELIKHAQEPLVYFHYDHGFDDIVLPTVCAMHRAMGGLPSIDRISFLNLQIIQLQHVFQDFCLIEATSDSLISKKPANIIKSTFTSYNLEGEGLECLSRCYVIFADGCLFAVEMSGPLEGRFRSEEQFKAILMSIRID